jgi:hypothetical protein
MNETKRKRNVQPYSSANMIKGLVIIFTKQYKKQEDVFKDYGRTSLKKYISEINRQRSDDNDINNIFQPTAENEYNNTAILNFVTNMVQINETNKKKGGRKSIHEQIRAKDVQQSVQDIIIQSNETTKVSMKKQIEEVLGKQISKSGIRSLLGKQN